MICPSCGAQNPDDAPMCSECRYRFRFGHAFNDPAQPVMPDFTGKGKSGRFPLAVRLLVIILFIIIMAMMVWLYLRVAGKKEDVSDRSLVFRKSERIRRSGDVVCSTDGSAAGFFSEYIHSIPTEGVRNSHSQ